MRLLTCMGTAPSCLADMVGHEDHQATRSEGLNYRLEDCREWHCGCVVEIDNKTGLAQKIFPLKINGIIGEQILK